MNPHVKCNALYKTTRNFNCYLTAAQAVEFAHHLLGKAQLLFADGQDGSAVQLWNEGPENEKIYFGIVKARKGSRRPKKATPGKANNRRQASTGPAEETSR
jgi:hypothetical protein